MRKIFFIAWAIALVSSVASCIEPEKVTETEVVWEISTIRVDDDSEYHFTAIKETGYVVTESDLDYEIAYIRHTNVNNPIIKVIKKCGEWNGCWYESDNYKIILPKGYRVETFED